MEVLTTFWNNLTSVFQTIGVSDVADVILVAYLIYLALRLVRETRAEQLLKGLFLFVALFVVANWLGLRSLSYILDMIYQFGVIALLIVFQPELRRALEQIGRSRIGTFSFLTPGSAEEALEYERRVRAMIGAVVEAVTVLSGAKTGAIIVLERRTGLGDIVSTGSVIDAKPSKEIICNIFYDKAPLHDGAMIVRAGRIWAAGCFLPLSDTQRISRDLGTRHRAAIGMSEISDALVVVVSEESGTISLADNGLLTRPYNPTTLTSALERAMLPEEKPEIKDKAGFIKNIFTKSDRKK